MVSRRSTRLFLITALSLFALPPPTLATPYTFASASLSALQVLLPSSAGAALTSHAARSSVADLLALTPSACALPGDAGGCAAYAQLEVNDESCTNAFCNTPALDSINTCFNCLILTSNTTISTAQYGRVQSQLSVIQSACTNTHYAAIPPAPSVTLVSLARAGERSNINAVQPAKLQGASASTNSSIVQAARLAGSATSGAESSRRRPALLFATLVSAVLGTSAL